MKKFYTILFTAVFILYSNLLIANPGDNCVNPIDLGTPAATRSCNTYNTSATLGTLALPTSCSSLGNSTSSGPVTWFKFCTNSSGHCINFSFEGINTGGIEVTIWSDCNSSFLNSTINQNSCFPSGIGQYSTRQYNLSPSTCYYLRIRSVSAGTINLCTQSILPGANDDCSGAIVLTTSPTATNNYCYTYSSNEPPPITFGASQGDNSAWFMFTPQCSGSVTVNINNISCTGSSTRIQIGFYTGNCSNLTNVGSTTFLGSNMPPLTISGLTAGQNVYILIDGDLGSLCSWNISATNTIPTITPPQTICRGRSVTLTALGGTSYLWTPGGATTSSINVSPTSTTNYSCRVNNCTFTTLNTTVTVDNSITPLFNQIDTICAGNNFTLSGTSINGITGTWSPAINNTATTTYTFTPTAGQCAATTTMKVVITQPVTPVFNQINTICAGSNFILPATSINGITGTWSPSVNNTASTTYTFTPNAGQCATTTTMTVVVTQPITPVFNQIDTICAGSNFTLPATSTNGVTGTWSPIINNTATTLYTFTPNNSECATTTNMTVVVKPRIIPVFNQIDTICNGVIFNLPVTSNNGITGTWTPAIDNTITTTYTFTPDPSQCAAIASMTVVVKQPIIPLFNQIDTICFGNNFILPLTSNNGITGVWTPDIDNTITTTYTFTPDLDQCATTTTMTVVVKVTELPTFNQQTPICSGGFLSLPVQSTNGITGNWSPAINNTANTTYTFTSTSRACMLPTTMTVVVNGTTSSTTNLTICNNQIPYQWNGLTFNAPGTQTATLMNASGCDSFATLHLLVNSYSLSTTNKNICSAINSYSWNGINYTASGTYSVTLPGSTGCDSIAILNLTFNLPVLPLFSGIGPFCSSSSFSLPVSSSNGITGSWSPAINNTTTTTYTFTPGAAQCASTTTLTVAITSNIIPVFTLIDTICTGTSFSLPSTSENGISGTWTPAINNTATTIYTFTPDAANCATPITKKIVVKPHIVPVFSTITTQICTGGNIVLPTISNNNINGSWSPAINNTTSTTYTFTPDITESSKCPITKTVRIVVKDFITPTFSIIGPFCSGTSFTLPTRSNNGIDGYWTPVINNTATTTYTFTPTSGECPISVTKTVIINQPVIPNFTPIGPICSDTTFTLPTLSNDNITGSWSPAINNTATTTYTFVPDAGQCATNTTMTVAVNQPVTPAFTQIGPICSGTTFSLPAFSNNNNISGSWTPAVNNTATTTYTFTPDLGQCATTTTMTVQVNQPTTPEFNQIAPICTGYNFILLSSSNNNITGTWSPAINNTATTTYIFTPNASACAINDTMTVVVNVATASTTTLTICNNLLPFVWNNITFNGPDTRTAILTNANGCDSLATLHLLVNSYSSTITNVSICNPQTPYNWNGNNYTSSGTYSVTLTGSTGCDSILILNLSMNPLRIPTFAPIAPICLGSPFTLPTTSINGITGNWSPAIDNTITTTYTFTPDPNQCASATTMTVQVNSSFTTISIQSICQGESFTFPWGGVTSTPGFYNHLYRTLSGCDSIVNISLTINPVYTNSMNAVTCQGTPYNLPWGRLAITSGLYSYTYSSIHGCDSIVNINLTVTPTYTVNTQISICSGTSFTLPWGEVAASAGLYSHHYTTSNTCDSLVNVTIMVYNTVHHSATQEACNSYLWNGTTYTASGIHTFNYYDNQGCASVDTLHLTIHQGTHNTEIRTSCESYSWHGNTYTTSGVYLYQYNNTNGCVSVDTLHLTINSGTHNAYTQTSCENYTWHGTNYISSGVHLHQYNNVNGCLSVDTLHLTINIGTHNTASHTSCESYTWHGTVYLSSGIYTYQYNNTNGCLSVDTLHLTINHGTHNEVAMTSCESYSWHGNIYTTSGIYLYQYNNTNGCASLDTLHLTINYGTHNSYTQISCESYTWHGTNYTTSGVYVYQYNNARGCVSVDTLHLTINYGTHNAYTQSICESYTWHGTNYTSSGIYLYQYNNANGCASVDTLHLTIHLPTSSVTAVSVCSNALPYLWNGQQYNSSGIYTANLVNVNGCDSLATLNLSITQVPTSPVVTASVIVCQYDPSVTLFAVGAYPLVWYNYAAGGTGSNMVPVVSTSLPGIFHYYVSQINNNCESPRSLINIRVIIKPNLGSDKDLKVCFGNVVNLQSLYNTSNLFTQWTSGNNPVSNVSNINTSGNYQLIVNNSNRCGDTVAVTITMLPQVIANAGPNGNAVYNEPYQLQGSGGSHYLWTPAYDLNNASYSNPLATLTESTQFVLLVSDDYGCSDKDTVNITVFKVADIYMPNAFTPNGDGLNDVIKPTCVGIKKLEYFIIYNRFGNLIFESHDIGKGWNGFYKGAKQPTGNYIYVIKGFDKDGKEKFKKGSLLLIQ